MFLWTASKFFSFCRNKSTFNLIMMINLSYYCYIVLRVHGLMISLLSNFVDSWFSFTHSIIHSFSHCIYVQEN